MDRPRAARDEPTRPDLVRAEAARPQIARPGDYELAHIDGVDDEPSPTLRRRRLLVGIVAVVAIVALAVTAIGVGSIVFLMR